ncbi:hypothetical protein H2198_001007 [Neophaeococcomyces mojaviensis]|uniref:Uncharacterized protein n=1 Tax=Neophaeococcomyces mojaviensis TaxID=3383035 RepID=A0ACC3AIK1_9EURO|nr:hypothetical protein H2198_001007 [Knufia sp. JES_112]
METSPPSYIPNQPYNNADGFLPPSTILEPADFNNDNGILRLQCKPFVLHSSTYGNPDLLRIMSSMPLPPVSYTASKYNWDYKKRREAQAILPFLYLGQSTNARDADYLRNNGITMVIAVRSAQSARARPKGLNPAQFPSCAGLETTTFDVDSPYDIITRIKPVLKMMTNHLERHSGETTINQLEDIGGRILVFCETGNERSPVLVAAYLMLVYGISWGESLNYIMARRFSVCLPSGMNEMLKTWEGMLQAESQIAAVVHNNNAQNSPTRLQINGRTNKRLIDDAYDSDETMTDEHEVGVRPGIAPFR